jgi:hypothetical protein
MVDISNSTNCIKKNFIVAISPKPVILIGMRIEKDFNQNENDSPSATEAMEASMDAIMNLAIEPAMNQDLIDAEGATILALVGGVLKKIASKAEAYERMFGEGNPPENYQN